MKLRVLIPLKLFFCEDSLQGKSVSEISLTGVTWFLPLWLAWSSSFLLTAPGFCFLLNVCSCGDKCTPQLRKALEVGGQKCWCRAVTSLAVMEGCNITHTKAGRHPKVTRLEPDSQTNPLKPMLHWGPFSCWKSERAPAEPEWLRLHRLLLRVIKKKKKKVAEPLWAVHMVSPFPRLNYRPIGCCKKLTHHPSSSLEIQEFLKTGRQRVKRYLGARMQSDCISADATFRCEDLSVDGPWDFDVWRKVSRLWCLEKDLEAFIPWNTQRTEMSDAWRYKKLRFLYFALECEFICLCKDTQFPSRILKT